MMVCNCDRELTKDTLPRILHNFTLGGQLKICSGAILSLVLSCQGVA